MYRIIKSHEKYYIQWRELWYWVTNWEYGYDTEKEAEARVNFLKGYDADRTEVIKQL